MIGINAIRDYCIRSYYYSDSSPTKLRSVQTDEPVGHINKLSGYRLVSIKIACHVYKVKVCKVVLWLHSVDTTNGIIDHIDRDKLNDEFSNLRVCSSSGNNMNKPTPVNNRSGAKGVSWNSRDCKWQVHISVNKRRVSLGYYEDLELATLIAEEARVKYHREFCCND